jgi:hypothetical protein
VVRLLRCQKQKVGEMIDASCEQKRKNIGQHGQIVFMKKQDF